MQGCDDQKTLAPGTWVVRGNVNNDRMHRRLQRVPCQRCPTIFLRLCSWWNIKTGRQFPWSSGWEISPAYATSEASVSSRIGLSQSKALTLFVIEKRNRAARWYFGIIIVFVELAIYHVACLDSIRTVISYNSSLFLTKYRGKGS